MAVAALSLAIIMGPTVWAWVRELLRKNRQLESRIQAIENLSEPFASNVARAVPVPLGRVIHVNIHFDETFWRETLKLSSEELEEIKTSVPLHNEFSKDGLEQFEKWFYLDIHIRIQEWRGGYKHVDVQGPLQERSSREFYPGGRADSCLWSFSLPPRPGDIGLPSVTLSIDEFWVRLWAFGGRFGYDEPLPLFMESPNSFLAVPLTEGRAAAPFHKQDYKIETWPDVYQDVKPWLRCYQNLDIKQGLAWQLWIQDCELFARSGGNSYQADSCLLEDYRRIIADYRTGEENRAFYQHLADSIEARREAERIRILCERLDRDEADAKKGV